MHPNGPVRLTVTVGADRVALSGRKSPEHWLGPDALLRTGVVVYRHGEQVATGYSIPRYFGSFRHAREVSDIGSRDVHGYVCLVRFQPRQPMDAMVGVVPGFMGAAPDLVILGPGGQKSFTGQTDFRPYSLILSHGAPLIRAGDFAFHGRFDCDGCSGLPLRFFTVKAGHLVNVSGDHPDAITRDARKWWRLAHRRTWIGRGFLAAWAADEYTLGNEDRVYETLNRLAAHGRFNVERDWAHGARYVTKLEDFLAHTGYGR